MKSLFAHSAKRSQIVVPSRSYFQTWKRSLSESVKNATEEKKPSRVNVITAQRNFMDQLASKLELPNLDHWTKISNKQISENGGQFILDAHDESLYSALKKIYPEHKWDSKQFGFLQKPKNWWKDPKTQKEFLDSLAKDLNIKEMSDWNKVSVREVSQRGGRGLLTRYNDSLIEALKAVYPEYDWKSNSKLFVTSGFWRKRENQRNLFDEIFKKLNFTHLDDWYNASWQQAIESGAGSVLRYYSGSFITALIAIYPEHNWDILKFKRLPLHFWENKENQKKFFDQIGKELNIKEPSDWGRISVHQVNSKGANGFLQKYYGGSLQGALEAVYPNYNWKTILKNSGNLNKTQQVSCGICKLYHQQK